MTRPLAHIRRVLATGSAFLLFFIGGTLLSYVLLPLARLCGGAAAEKARRCRTLLGHSWVFFWWYMRALGLIRFDPRTTRFELPAGPFVMVANHPTLLDVTALIATCPDLVSVAKPAMFKSPLVGRLLRSCEHIRGSDGTLLGGAAVIDEAVERLRAGVPVLIFPEGTRSPCRGLRQFQPGAFEIAARAEVPILPVYISCEPPTLMRGEPWYAVPDRQPTMTFAQLPALSPPHGDARQASLALRAAYLARIAPSQPQGGPADSAQPSRTAATAEPR